MPDIYIAKPWSASLHSSQLSRVSPRGRNASHVELALSQEFAGNRDRDTPVRHVLERPFVAKGVTFHPTAWQGSISMRVELYGCNLGTLCHSIIMTARMDGWRKRWREGGGCMEEWLDGSMLICHFPPEAKSIGFENKQKMGLIFV